MFLGFFWAIFVTFSVLNDDENIFHNSLHDYYQIRPKDDDEEEVVIIDKEENNDNSKWDKKCLADFVSQFNIAYRRDENAIMLQDEKSFGTSSRVSDLEQVAIILIIHLSSLFLLSLFPGCYFSTRRVGARALKFDM